MQPQDVVCKLVKTCLHVNEAVRLAERKFILEVFDQVRRIFEYITVNEYTVWFLVPCLNNKDAHNNVDSLLIHKFTLGREKSEL